MTTVDELVSLLSQKSQKQTPRSTHPISRVTGLTQSSIVLIIHRDLGLKCFSFTNMLAVTGYSLNMADVFLFFFGFKM